MKLLDRLKKRSYSQTKTRTNSHPFHPRKISRAIRLRKRQSFPMNPSRPHRRKNFPHQNRRSFRRLILSRRRNPYQKPSPHPLVRTGRFVGGKSRGTVRNSGSLATDRTRVHAPPIRATLTHARKIAKAMLPRADQKVDQESAASVTSPQNRRVRLVAAHSLGSPNFWGARNKRGYHA